MSGNESAPGKGQTKYLKKERGILLELGCLNEDSAREQGLKADGHLC
jgi:hypothetical protein